MINFDKITDIFCTVDEFCAEFEKFTQAFILGNPPKKKARMSNSEVITIIILFQLSGFRTFKHFYTRCAFRNIGKKIVHLIKKSYIYLTTNHLNT